MQDALLFAQGVGHRADRTGSAAQHDRLGAQIVAQVDVGGGQHDIMMVVLRVHQFRAELSLMVVVHQSDGAQSHLILLPFFLYEVFTQQIAQELRAVGVTALIGEPFKLGVEVFVEREGSTDEIGHGYDRTSARRRGSHGRRRHPLAICRNRACDYPGGRRGGIEIHTK